MAGLMNALGVALCYVLSAGVISGCIAFVVLASKMQREKSDPKQRR